MGKYEEWKEALEEKSLHINMRKIYAKTYIYIYIYIYIYVYIERDH